MPKPELPPAIVGWAGAPLVHICKPLLLSAFLAAVLLCWWPTMTASEDILPPRDIPGRGPTAQTSQSLIVGIDPSSALFGAYEAAAFGSGGEEALSELRSTLSELAQVPLSGATLGSGGEVTISVDVDAIIDKLVKDFEGFTAVSSIARLTPVKGATVPFGIMVQLSPDAPPISELISETSPVITTDVGEDRHIIAVDTVVLNSMIVARLDENPAIRYAQPNYQVDLQ